MRLCERHVEIGHTTLCRVRIAALEGEAENGGCFCPPITKAEVREIQLWVSPKMHDPHGLFARLYELAA